MSFNNRGYMALECACDEQPFIDELGVNPEVDESISDEEIIARSEDTEFVDALGDANELTQRLAEIQDIARAAHDEKEPLTSLGGHALVIAAEAAMNEMGMEPEGMVPPKEAFKKPETAKEATKAAMESLSEVVSKATASIIGGAYKVSERVRTSIREMFVSLKRLDNRAEAISKKIEESDFEAGKPVDLSLAKRTAGGLKGITNFQKQLQIAESFVTDARDTYINKIHPLMAKVAYSPDANNDFAYPSVPAGMKKVPASALPSEHSGLSGDDFDFYVSDKSSGGYFVYGIFPKAKNPDALVDTFLTGWRSIGLHFGNKEEASSIKTLSKNEASQLVDSVKALSKYLKDEASRAKQSGIAEKIATKINSIDFKQGPTSPSKKKTQVGRVYKACLNYMSNFSSMMWFPARIRTKAIDSANAALDLIEASIKK